MEELTFSTLIAVFEEIFGRGLFWTMVAVAALVTVAYVYVLVRDRELSMRKFFWAQMSMPLGAVLAVAFTLFMTDSGVGDMGGAIDVIVLLGVALLGAVGMSILVYTVEALVAGRREEYDGEFL